jgi:putative heme-binding domain-containing protein
VGRSSLDALLANIIDPNQLIGAGYENVEVTTKDERSISGRMIENTESRVKILSLGPKEEVIARTDIDNIRVSEMSVMPEGLEQMPDEDFRNMIWYLLNPPEDNKAILVYPGEKRLVVKARVPGRSEYADLVTYVADPALRPYLHPVKDPSGTIALTQDKPDDHPWQHGMFTGLHKVNGVDFWSEKEGQQRFRRFQDIAQEQDHVAWRSVTDWVRPDGSVEVEEEQFVKVWAPGSAEQYTIDFDWTLRAIDKAVTVGRHEYGGFAVRLEYSPEHTHLNSAGQRGKAAADQRAGWCNVARDFGGQTYGVVVHDHPSNLGYPSKWRVDGQGLINPSPSLLGDWTIDRGGSRTFRYRLAVHAGAGDAQKFDAAHKSYSALHAAPASAAASRDGESVALWNPEWKLNAPDFENTPAKLPEFAGKRNVLMTHPFDEKKPSSLERTVAVPAGARTILTFSAAAHEQGDWEARVYVNDQLVKKQMIDREGGRWKVVSVDLTPHAGQQVKLRLENAANNWSWEFGYWHDVKLSSL